MIDIGTVIKDHEQKIIPDTIDPLTAKHVIFGLDLVHGSKIPPTKITKVIVDVLSELDVNFPLYRP